MILNFENKSIKICRTTIFIIHIHLSQLSKFLLIFTRKVLTRKKYKLQSEKRRVDEDWITALLSLEFFGICMNHKYLRKNEKNVFCIDCNAQICRHCCDTEAHFLHRRLQICKYVYQDVLRLLDIQHYFDCSEIQVFSWY